MNVVEEIELMECNKIVDSDHRRHSIDLHLEINFEEESNNEQHLEQMLFNPNKRTHRKEFVET